MVTALPRIFSTFSSSAVKVIVPLHLVCLRLLGLETGQVWELYFATLPTEVPSRHVAFTLGNVGAYPRCGEFSHRNRFKILLWRIFSCRHQILLLFQNFDHFFHGWILKTELRWGVQTQRDGRLLMLNSCHYYFGNRSAFLINPSLMCNPWGIQAVGHIHVRPCTHFEEIYTVLSCGFHISLTEYYNP